MRERPILFSAPMVRAILAGTKTQTRRPYKTRKHPDFGCAMAASELVCEPQHVIDRTCPYGQPGDRLWVREAWCPIYPQDPHYNGGRPIGIDYKASHSRESDQWRVMDDLGTRRWKPSIHMPRSASRILLEITGIRVERLQDISETDALAEGSRDWADEQDTPARDIPGGETRLIYRQLWESINGPGSWDANPWVWVIEFMRVE